VLQSVLELTRTVVQRKSQAGARIRLDIAGYNERRREALRIYARRLAEQVVEDRGEIMLEPMNPAERKVVHDALVEVDGVRTFSEGEEPERSVVIAPE
jgi:spoIIIJ-associated protein